MANRPKQIGTWGETHTLRYLKPYFPDAKRVVLHGNADEGDLQLNKDWVVEVKAGKQTMQVGPKKMQKWVDEMWTEIGHSGSKFGVLVLQRSGYGEKNVGKWWAYIALGHLLEVTGTPCGGDVFDIMLRMELGELVQILVEANEVDAVPDAA